MTELIEARNRVGRFFLNLMEEQEVDVTTVIETAGGAELLAKDLFTLLAATKPRERRAPSMKSAERRLKRRDPETSFQAAVSTTPELSQEMYEEIYRVLHLNRAISGLTDEQLIYVLTTQLHRQYTQSGIRSRRAELVDAGWVVDSGLKRPTVAGRKSIVWAAAVDS